MRWVLAIVITLTLMFALGAVLDYFPELGVALTNLVVFGTAIWAGIDCARVRRRKPNFAINPVLLSLILLFVCWPLGFPIYLAARFGDAWERRRDESVELTGSQIDLSNTQCQVCGAEPLTGSARSRGICDTCQAKT
jgi:hypothetical protein